MLALNEGFLNSQTLDVLGFVPDQQTEPRELFFIKITELYVHYLLK